MFLNVTFSRILLYSCFVTSRRQWKVLKNWREGWRPVSQIRPLQTPPVDILPLSSEMDLWHQAQQHLIDVRILILPAWEFCFFFVAVFSFLFASPFLLFCFLLAFVHGSMFLLFVSWQLKAAAQHHWLCLVVLVLFFVLCQGIRYMLYDACDTLPGEYFVLYVAGTR